jgi:hypothetical protein
MNYTLITPKGRVYQFYLKSVAETFLEAYGGTLFDNSVVQTAEMTV